MAGPCSLARPPCSVEGEDREGFFRVIVSLLPWELRAGRTICPALPRLMAANWAGVSLMTRGAFWAEGGGRAGGTGLELRVTTWREGGI